MKLLNEYLSLPGVLLLSVLLFISCSNDGGPTDPEGLTETGPRLVLPYVHELTNGDLRMNVRSDPNPGFAVDLVHELGSMTTPPAPHGLATAEVFADETGKTFWVSAEAPTRNGIHPDSTIGSVAGLRQIWKFRKESPNASLRFVISGTLQELLDDNSQPIDTRQVCPWGYDSNSADIEDVCGYAQKTMIVAQYDASMFDSVKISDGSMMPGQVTFFRTSGWAAIEGFAEQQDPQISIGYQHQGDRPLFSLSDFDIEHPSGLQRYTQMRLKSPITVEVPLDSVPVGKEFQMGVLAEARAWTRRRNEAYVAAYFRDPASTGGMSVEHNGLELLDPSSETENISIIPPATPCEANAGEGSGGTIQFESTSYFKPEWPGDAGDFAEIVVSRTGGTGEASALITTGGGTATAGSRDTPGSDYMPVTTNVWFAEGEMGTKAIFLPIIGDTEIEPDETVMLTLTDPGGCVTIGGQSSAVLTIWDDDQPGGIDDEGHTIGGAVTGLEGNGLVLTNNSTADLEIMNNGPFVFDRRYGDGVIYNVRVDTQPDNPAQACTVTNGNGTVAGADITDIEVTCETLFTAGDNLDPAFGSGGKVTLEVGYTGVQGDAPDIALQDDGKIVVVSGNTLARYNTNGNLDGSFGTNGVVTVDFYGSRDRLNAVGIQPDGRIVVAGYSQDGVNSPTQDDIIVARYNTDGTLDTNFGQGGKVVTDFESHQEIAYDLLIQSDGKIVVSGLAATIDEGGFGVYYPDFAAARYTSSGELDDSFGTGGKVTTNIAGDTDFSYAAALQSNGKIVLTGRVGESGGSNPDIGVARYNADGSLDTSFGDDGILRNKTSFWDEAADVVVQPDGKIMVVGFTLHEGGVLNSVPDSLTIERYNVDGSYDATFGTDGRVQTPLMAPGRAIALQPDGSIVIAGVEQSGASPDYAIARFTPSGELDTNFGTGGLIQVDFFGDLDIANAVVLQPDGKIVVAGSVRNGVNMQLGLIRVLP